MLCDVSLACVFGGIVGLCLWSARHGHLALSIVAPIRSCGMMQVLPAAANGKQDGAYIFIIVVDFLGPRPEKMKRPLY